MTHRRRVLILLILLFAITYLDRVCISVAAPRIQAELNIDPVGWGWVTGMFTLAYCLFAAGLVATFAAVFGVGRRAFVYARRRASASRKRMSGVESASMKI